jgi:uncharacterized membrane protein required for colicin V production
MFIDIGIIAIILLFLIIGLFKGFFKSVLGLIGTVVSLIITFFLARWLTDLALGNDGGFFNKLVLGDTMSLKSLFVGWLDNTALSGVVIGAESGELTDVVGGGLAAVLGAILSALAPGTTGSLVEVTATLLSTGIFFSIVAIVLFIVLKIILAILNSIVDRIRQNKTLRGIDRFFGMLVGAAKGFFTVAIILVVSSFFINLPFMSWYKEAVDGSTIGRPLYNTFTTWSAKLLPLDDWLGKYADVQGHEQTEEETALTESLKALGDDLKPLNTQFGAAGFNGTPVQNEIKHFERMLDKAETALLQGAHKADAGKLAASNQALLSAGAAVKTDVLALFAEYNNSEGKTEEETAGELADLVAALEALNKRVENDVMTPLGFTVAGYGIEDPKI